MVRRKALFGALIFLLLSGPDCLATTDAEGKLLHRYKLEMKCPEGIKLCNSILASHPNDYVAVLYRGLFKAWTGKIAEGQRDFRRAMGLKPDDYQAPLHLANTLIGQEKLDEAQKLVDWLLKKHPYLSASHHLQAILLMRQKKYSEALPIFATLAALKEADLAGIVTDHWTCLAHLRRFKEADAIFDKHSKIIKWWAVYGSANTAIAENNNEACLYMVKRSPELNCRERAYLLTLANANSLLLGPAEEARRQWASLKPLYAETIVHVNMARLYQKKKLMDKMKAEIEAIPPKSRDYEVVDMLFNAHLKELKYEQSIDDLTALIQFCATKTQKAYVYTRRGDIRAMISQLDQAIADYTTAINLSPYNAHLFRKRADLYDDMGDQAHARADRAKAERLDRR